MYVYFNIFFQYKKMISLVSHTQNNKTNFLSSKSGIFVIGRGDMFFFLPFILLDSVLVQRFTINSIRVFAFTFLVRLGNVL